MGFYREIENAASVLRLKEPEIAGVWNRREAAWWGALILFLPAVVNLVLLWSTFPSGFSGLFSRFLFWPMLIPPIALGVTFFLIGLAARFVFGVAAVDYWGFFRVLSYASIFIWSTIVPFLLEVLGLSLGRGFLHTLWFLGFGLILMVAYRLLVGRYRLSERDALVCLVVAILAYFLVNFVLGSVLVGGAYRVIY